ncbi:hypothetical protein NDU88_003572 [Pleurodeles waltl]|uniref:Uncharacterized protein n=1 Tax=Pleurodeles waltl TaxID=8319 RepID=A0AAV7T6K3_PLEWA|nr:hypothetical protein NDU88_003572 [Pleurodeles waltl]
MNHCHRKSSGGRHGEPESHKGQSAEPLLQEGLCVVMRRGGEPRRAERESAVGRLPSQRIVGVAVAPRRGEGATPDCIQLHFYGWRRGSAVNPVACAVNVNQPLGYSRLQESASHPHLCVV